MAAAMTAPDLVVRAARPGEGRAVAALWRELWDAHEDWGGYHGSRDPRVYDQLAARLEEDARVRGGHPVLGRHVHLVAALKGELLGQVEGWFERHGVDPATPSTCEVRSLIVRAAVRRSGAGRALLDTLARQASSLSRGAPCVLAAEVLEPNPAHTFYSRVGYAPVAWSARITTDAPIAQLGAGAWSSDPRASAARLAAADDALAVAMLDATLAGRRRASGDMRFDRPRAVDATIVGAIAAHLAHIAATGTEPTELVAIDERGVVRASASLAVMPLDPPFLPAKRGILGRFAVDAASDPRRLVPPLVALGCRLAASRGAATMELTDLTAPGTPLHEATLAIGARPWSRVVTKLA
jgi:GNAT superfamily N-acetyltransferase